MFRPRKHDRAHPRELLECAFDIVSPVTNSLLPDAEVIYTISEIIQEFPALQVSIEGPLRPPKSSCYYSGPVVVANARHGMRAAEQDENKLSLCEDDFVVEIAKAFLM